MKFKVVTVYNRLDGFSNGLFVVRNENTFCREFINNFNNQNEQLKAKKMPINNLSDFEIKVVGSFDDESCMLESCDPVTVPFSKGVDEES